MGHEKWRATNGIFDQGFIALFVEREDTHGELYFGDEIFPIFLKLKNFILFYFIFLFIDIN